MVMVSLFVVCAERAGERREKGGGRGDKDLPCQKNENQRVDKDPTSAGIDLIEEVGSSSSIV